MIIFRNVRMIHFLAFILISITRLSTAEETCSTLKSELNGLKRTVEQQHATIEALQSQMGLIQTSNDAIKEDLQSFKAEVIPAKYNTFTDYGCMGDILELSCSGDTQILITSADYCEYNTACEDDDECCPPHPFNDCSEDMEFNRQSEWVSLKQMCDGTSSCSYQFTGTTFVQNCTPLGVADYVSIYYSCLPDQPTNQVGFTVYSTIENKYYTENELIRYDTAISNIGGHYNLDQNLFICPYSGIYMFHVHVETDLNSGFSFKVNLIIDGNFVIQSAAEYNSMNLVTGANTVVTHCATGQKVWLESRGNFQNAGQEITLNSFSGILVHLDNVGYY